jgi:hypothetical protein
MMRELVRDEQTGAVPIEVVLVVTLLLLVVLVTFSTLAGYSRNTDPKHTPESVEGNSISRSQSPAAITPVAPPLLRHPDGTYAAAGG